jgi:hypothetical protein
VPDASGGRYPDFTSIWARADLVPGWLTRAQAGELWTLASEVPSGAQAVEIGSHQGRSTLVLAAALQARAADLVAVDPFVDGKLFGGPSTRSRFEEHVADSGLGASIRLVAERSTALRPGWSSPIAFLYIDGKHDYWTVSDDLKWVAHLPEGAAFAIHDAFSSVGVTLGLLAHVLPSGRVRYVRRTGSLAVFRRERASLGDRLRLVGQLPWFARNVVVKVALRVARLAGHRRPDPY